MLSEKVMKMSTKPENRDQKPNAAVQEEEIMLRQVLRELEATQRQLMIRHQQLDIAVARRATTLA